MIGSLKPEKAFLCLAIPLGLVLLCAIPPFQVEDEHAHFWHAYALSEFQILPERLDSAHIGGYVPESVVQIVYRKPYHGLGGYPDNRMRLDDLWPVFRVPLEPQKKAFAHYPGVAFYSPVAYVAPAAAILLGRLFSLPPLVLLYLGRCGAFAAWLALMFLAVRTAPVAKWIFFLLALLPLALFQAAGLSADSFSAAICFLTIAAFLRCAYGPDEKLAPRQLRGLFALCVLLALSKQSYFLVPFLYLLIPPGKIGGPRRYWLTFAALLSAAALALGIWGGLTTPLMSDWTGGVDPYAQVKFILTHPFEYVWLVLRTFKHEQSMVKFIGRPGWEDFSLPEVLVWLHLAALILVTFLDHREEVQIPARGRVVIFATLCASVFLIATLLYMQWNPVGNPAVRGVQHGRYFVPLAPLLFLPFYGLRLRRDRVVPICAAISLVWALFVILKRYYG